MKKIALISLICIYSFSILGIGIKQFYCCGKLKSTTISFVQEAREKSDKGNAMDDCCKTTFKNLTIKDTHVGADGISSPAKYFTELYLFPAPPIVVVLAKEPRYTANPSHAPPFQYSVPIYILHCAYLI